MTKPIPTRIKESFGMGTRYAETRAPLASLCYPIDASVLAHDLCRRFPDLPWKAGRDAVWVGSNYALQPVSAVRLARRLRRLGGLDAVTGILHGGA